MASHSLRATHVELHEFEIAKPQPLRIIKHSQTVSDCSAGGEVVRGGRGSSGSSEQSRGSPPMGADRPLTVRKKRAERGSVFTASLDEPPVESSYGSAVEDLVRRYSDTTDSQDEPDPDLTPKAKQPIARTLSAGAYLKTELHRRGLDIEADRYSVRGNRHHVYSPGRQYHSPTTPQTAKRASPKLPERKPSKSKNFFLRAIGGRSSGESKSTRRSDSTIPRSNTLIRRISKGRGRSSEESYTDSIASSNSISSFEPQSADICDISINSRLSSSSSSSSPAVTTATNDTGHAVILSPQVFITPELRSVDTSSCSFWVGIEVLGNLNKVDGYESRDVGDLRVRSISQNLRSPDLRRYGRLHSMRIDLHPGQNCTVIEVIGDLHTSKTIRAGETQLILAKIRLGPMRLSTHARISRPDDLLTALETDLGDILTSYLTVRLTYKHSGIPCQKSPAMNTEGISTHISRLQTEATAVIRRHNSLSAWSPRTSQTMNSPLESNPLIPLIDTHLSKEKAREALHRLGDDRKPIPLARRFGDLGGSSEEIVKPKITTHINSTIASDKIPKDSMIGGWSRPKEPSGHFARLPSTYRSQKESDDIDPARKIWTEMRRRSRGPQHRHPRGSISADHYFSFEEDDSPSRMSSGQTSVSTLSHGGHAAKPAVIDQERTRIMEVALRNKRSVGTETLRSIAPSVSQSVGKSKGGTLSSLGLGSGRSWGWGSPWW